MIHRCWGGCRGSRRGGRAGERVGGGGTSAEELFVLFRGG